VTAEFPVTTGLREGSVLSPLLFVLFMCDIQTTVLRPFARADYWKRDPELNGVPIPGLLYADDLVLFCLSPDLLRERLRRLCDYAFANTLTVNVGKCEVVIFGKAQPLVFKYNREVIPVRRSCKYLGVWLNGDLSGRALAEAIMHKFVAGVPVFFSLCRRLRLARLDLVHRLASSLVFSLLYGCEFLKSTDVVSKCEAAWWRGVRSFYGLPNGVSTVFLRLLFPRVSVPGIILRSKFSLLFRGSSRLETLFPEAVVVDRRDQLAVHRVGYSQVLKDWCQYFGVSDAFEAANFLDASNLLAASRALNLDSDWSQFSSMASTSFASSLFGTRRALYLTFLEASKFGVLGVRAAALAVAGALSVSYNKSRFCLCGEKFCFEHFLACSFLGHDVTRVLQSSVSDGNWEHVAVILLSRFEVYIHALREGVLRDEEVNLFSLLAHHTSNDSEEPELAGVFYD
jgi:hypothetical protein